MMVDVFCAWRGDNILLDTLSQNLFSTQHLSCAATWPGWPITAQYCQGWPMRYQEGWHMGDNDIRNVDDDQAVLAGRALLCPAELSRDEMIILIAMTSILTLHLTLIISLITLTRLITLPMMILTHTWLDVTRQYCTGHWALTTISKKFKCSYQVYFLPTWGFLPVFVGAEIMKMRRGVFERFMVIMSRTGWQCDNAAS